MKGPPSGFWGKLRQDATGAIAEWHPLSAHAADVAACCEALLQLTILRRRLGRLAGRPPLTDVDIARLSALAALHDLGKFNSGFQRKGFPGAGSTAGHVAEILALLSDDPSREQERLVECIPLEALRSWAPDDGALQLLAAAIGHHGRPVTVTGTRHQSSYWEPLHGRDPFDGIRQLSARIQQWFPNAFADLTGGLPASAPFQHAFSGLVMLADWLGSDTRFFEYAQSDEDRMPHARRQAAHALRDAWVETSRARLGLGTDAPRFDSVSPHPPRPSQRAVASLAHETDDASLVLIESETGSGKTESALAHFVRLLHANHVDGLYFALPTRTAATQIHARVRAAVERAFPAHARPPVVLAVPGYLSVDDQSGERLAGFEVLWNDDPRQRFRYRGWAAEHPKRFLAGSVVVGTIDQALLSTLMVGHAHMRATSLLRHLLVVDEVHASDTYMTSLLACVLDNHLAAGGHALLMSATLGSAARARLLSRGSSKEPVQPLAAEIDRPYPAVTVRQNMTPAQLIDVSGAASPDKVVQRILQAWMADASQVATTAVDAARHGAAVLVLRNTVADCIATQRALEAIATPETAGNLLFRCHTIAAPHHSRFSKEDREALDRALEERVDTRSPGSGFVVAATQTVQQSLDLDFDFLLTDLCPMDVLLQRVGRLHRHPRSRPQGFTTPAVVLLIPAERDLTQRIAKTGKPTGTHGIGTVYDDLRILEATWRLLEELDRLRIPSANRFLVERTTHPDVLAELARSGDKWRAHDAWVKGVELSAKQLAKLNIVDRTRSFDDPHIGFPSDGLERHIATRLGEDDRLVDFTIDHTSNRSNPRLRSPFGTIVKRLTVPAFMARDIAADATPELLSSSDGQILFAFGNRRYVYDRLGIRIHDAEEPDDGDESG